MQATHLHSGFGWPGVMSPWRYFCGSRWAGPWWAQCSGLNLGVWVTGFRAEHAEVHSHSLAPDAYFLWITAERRPRGEGSSECVRPGAGMEAGSRRESGSTEELIPSGLVSNLSWCHPALIQLLGLNCSGPLTHRFLWLVNTTLSRAG